MAEIKVVDSFTTKVVVSLNFDVEENLYGKTIQQAEEIFLKKALSSADEEEKTEYEKVVELIRLAICREATLKKILKDDEDGELTFKFEFKEFNQMSLFRHMLRTL